MVTRCARQCGGRSCRSPTASKWCSIRIWRKQFDWQPLLQGVDQVVHLAGIAHTGAPIAAAYDRINRLATARAGSSRGASAHRAFCFHFLDPRPKRAGRRSRSDRTRRSAAPTDAYGRSKLAAEEAVRGSGVPFTILRPVLLYGPGVKGNLALLVRARRDRGCRCRSRISRNRRSLLGIDNFISALTFVLATPATIGETYVVADPEFRRGCPTLSQRCAQARGRRAFIMPMSPALYRAAAASIPARRRLAPHRRQFAGRCRQADRGGLAAGASIRAAG